MVCWSHSQCRAEALDSHLSVVKRDHEQISQIEEHRIRTDAAFEEAKRKEKALQEENARQEKARQEKAKAEAAAVITVSSYFLGSLQLILLLKVVGNTQEVLPWMLPFFYYQNKFILAKYIKG